MTEKRNHVCAKTTVVFAQGMRQTNLLQIFMHTSQCKVNGDDKEKMSALNEDGPAHGWE